MIRTAPADAISETASLTNRPEFRNAYLMLSLMFGYVVGLLPARRRARRDVDDHVGIGGQHMLTRPGLLRCRSR